MKKLFTIAILFFLPGCHNRTPESPSNSGKKPPSDTVGINSLTDDEHNPNQYNAEGINTTTGNGTSNSTEKGTGGEEIPGSTNTGPGEQDNNPGGSATPGKKDDYPGTKGGLNDTALENNNSKSNQGTGTLKKINQGNFSPSRIKTRTNYPEQKGKLTDTAAEKLPGR